MLRIKGTGVISQIAFVRKTFGEDGFEKWCRTLSEPARELVTTPIFASSWYEGDHAVLEIRNQICDLFYGGDPRGGRTIGRFSADQSLTGVYKVFVRLGAPEWTVGRVARIFGTFFEPGELRPVSSGKGYLNMHLTEFPAQSAVFEETICGFAHRALELSGCKDVNMERTKSIARGDSHAEFSGTWKV